MTAAGAMSFAPHVNSSGRSVKPHWKDNHARLRPHITNTIASLLAVMC